ncbi:MAG: hypothetical protein ACRDJF_10750 [Actinomycetota bacterium]
MGKPLSVVLGGVVVALLWYYVQFVLWHAVRIEARAVWIWATLLRKAEDRRLRRALAEDAERLADTANIGSSQASSRSTP